MGVNQPHLQEAGPVHLESLKTFCDVVETGSFSRAAQLNHITQSAVSQQIRALEERYGQKLLSRSARQVSATHAGERLFRGSKEVLTRFDEVEREIREQSQDVSGVAQVSAIYSVGLHELQHLQRALLKAHPKMNLRLNYRRSDAVYDDVIMGHADLGLVAYPQARAGLDILPYRNDRLEAVLPPGHALTKKKQVTFAALAEQPFVAFDREAPTRRAIDKLFRDHDCTFEPMMEMDNVETMKRAIELGLGVTVLPTPTVRHEVAQGTVVTRPFAEGTFNRPIGILIRKGKYLSRAGQAVLDALKASATEDA